MATASLIKEDPHIADTVNKTESYRVLRGRVNGLGYSPDARLMPYLELAGFGSAALIRTFDLRYDLISVLVERWRPETHTFHLSCGECTVTLEDVALQLRLPIDESSVTGVSAIAKPAALCYSLLGASPGDDESNLSGLKFTWLKANFQHLPDNATKEKLMCAARAYIMHIIGGVLMPDANNNRVHLMYLPLLTDLYNVRSYSWGSAVLAMLYRELCQTTKPHAADIGGCLILLQSWALYRMSFLASVSHQPYVYPLVNKWSIYPGIGRSYTVPIYRLLIEQHAGERFIWMSYRRLEIVAVTPSSTYIHSQLWCTNTQIISFNVVEWYHGDRVPRQFGCIQYIPDLPKEVGKVHGINKRGKHGMHWGVVHRRYIAMWDNRMGRRPRMDMSSNLQPSPEYMQWYFSMGKPYLLGAQSTVVPSHVQRPGVYEPVADIEPDPQPDLDPEREVELEAQPEAESEQSHSHSADTSYHPDFPNNDYFPGSSGGGYH
ncbi:serine/threonine-protein phosphatase 7 long form homolog [Gossypium hirsutum]|uniref:Serine/threonine-protein phosphatase 7 long form homolog n=1 Tax=Gossypium hirsutum TaxID=3635 RepID=A0ABM2Z6H8_GOSHI|nr:serine/threonine-protein phosphatase 7 long form homolog [Gossypium hirsutum]